MNNILKTYPDGSQLTVTGLAVTAGICVVTVVGSAVFSVKFNDWREERDQKWLQKKKNQI